MAQKVCNLIIFIVPTMQQEQLFLLLIF